MRQAEMYFFNMMQQLGLLKKAGEKMRQGQEFNSCKFTGTPLTVVGLTCQHNTRALE